MPLQDVEAVSMMDPWRSPPYSFYVAILENGSIDGLKKLLIDLDST
jgi:hypothetical protein